MATVPPGQPPAFDAVRRKYLLQYSNDVDRDVIVYCSAWTHGAHGRESSITDLDVHAFMEATYGLKRGALDLFIHTPGGSIDAAKAIMAYLRSKFSHIRAVVPQVALSAGTMIACACDEIVLAKHSSMGPIDPQFYLDTPMGSRHVAATAILIQFQQGIDAIKADPDAAAAWYSTMAQYGPDLLVHSKQAIDYSKEIVTEYLRDHMFKGDADAEKLAKGVAKALAAYDVHKSHGRHLSRDEVQAIGLKVVALEENQAWQDSALTVHHCFMLTAMCSGITKIVENHMGRCHVLRQ